MLEEVHVAGTRVSQEGRAVSRKLRGDLGEAALVTEMREELVEAVVVVVAMATEVTAVSAVSGALVTGRSVVVAEVDEATAIEKSADLEPSPTGTTGAAEEEEVVVVASAMVQEGVPLTVGEVVAAVAGPMVTVAAIASAMTATRLV